MLAPAGRAHPAAAQPAAARARAGVAHTSHVPRVARARARAHTPYRLKIDSTTTTSRQTPADTTQAQHEEIYSKYMQVKKGLHCHTLDSE